MAYYSEIEGVGFSIAGDEDNKRDSVVEVSSFELFSGALPVVSGCFDARMGTTDHHYLCGTCGHGRKEDPGHFGLMRSKVAIQSPLFISEIRRWLRIICLSCGAIVVPLDKLAYVPLSRKLTEAAKLVSDGLKCQNCGVIHPKIISADDDRFTFYSVAVSRGAGNPAPQIKLYSDIIRQAFERVSDASVLEMGRPLSSHPKNLILRNIIIPPNTMRPGVRMGYGASGTASHHDFTNLLQYIVKGNMRLPDVDMNALISGNLTPELDKYYQNAQQIYYDLVVGSSVSNAQNGRRSIMVGNRSFPSITKNFPRKTGRIRRHLLGKYMFNISRRTISGNPFLQIDEVGVPVDFARIMQIQETVQEFNRDRLMELFLNGRKQYPGCSRIIEKASGAVRRVEGLSRDFSIQIGDIIERDIITGDIAFFNRQPSLERSSSGVYRVVVLEDANVNTFQMNVTACGWHNADFDGDQMNLWVPRTAMTRVEAEYMSSVKNWFISTTYGAPVNGQVQDSNVGSFELTRSFSHMDKYHAMSLFGSTQIYLPDFSDVDVISGRELVSRLFEMTPFNFKRRSKWYNDAYTPYIQYQPDEIDTVIERGRMISGVLDKNSIGAGTPDGVYQLISQEYGVRAAFDMIYSLQQISIKFLENRGFTVGMADMLLTREKMIQIKEMIAGLLKNSDLITEKLIRGELLPPIGMTTHDFYERLQMEALRVPDEMLQPILTSISSDWNGLFKLIATGSKGAIQNMMHITSLIGQVELNTQRITEQFDFRRTAAYYPRFATSPDAYGLIRNSYISGMTAGEFTHSNKNSRFDLINKALSTASTGYQNNKAIMALQSCVIDNYRRVAKDTRVVQLLYGEDGIDTRKIEFVKFRTVFMDDEKLRTEFKYNHKPSDPIFEEAFKQIVADRDWYRDAYSRFEDFDFKNPYTNERQVAINVKRMVEDMKIASRGLVVDNDLPTLVRMQKRVNEFCGLLPYVFINEIQERRRTPIPLHLSTATRLTQMLIRTELSAPVLKTISEKQLEFILTTIRAHYKNALIDYGTAVGIITAQAIFAPLTQYMLDSAHRSVSGGTNKSGIVRPSEIFGAKPVEAEKGPEMLIRVKPEFEKNRTAVLQIANQIELMAFSRFIARRSILIEPFAKPVAPQFLDDKKWIDEFKQNHPLLTAPNDLSVWCARFELDKNTLILKGVSVETIVERLRAKHPNSYIIHTSENAPTVIIRAYFRESYFTRKGTLEERVFTAINEQFSETIISGVRGITLAEVDEIKRHIMKENGVVELETVYAVKTHGTNIAGVLLNKNIDPLRIVSTSIGDTEKVFGLCAGRGTIMREFRRFMGGKSPNIHHLSLCADEMSRMGRITSLEKGGVNIRERDNTLLRMAMSGPTQILQDAATSGSSGRIYGISPYLMLGRAPKLGTIWNDFGMDTEFVRKNTRTLDDVLDDI